MKKRIFRSAILAFAAVLSLSFVLIFGLLYAYALDTAQDRLKTETDLVSAGLRLQGESYLDAVSGRGENEKSGADAGASGVMPGQLRITWIGTDGRVLYDNEVKDVSAIENHLNRSEVRQALANGYGESQRTSSTLMEKYLYEAKRQEDGTVLRLAVKQNSVPGMLLGMLQPIITVIVIAFAVAAALAAWISKNVEKQLCKQGEREKQPCDQGE